MGKGGFEGADVVLGVIAETLKGGVGVVRLLLSKVSLVLTDPPVTEPARIKLLVEF